MLLLLLLLSVLLLLLLPNVLLLLLLLSVLILLLLHFVLLLLLLLAVLLLLLRPASITASTVSPGVAPGTAQTCSVPPWSAVLRRMSGMAGVGRTVPPLDVRSAVVCWGWVRKDGIVLLFWLSIFRYWKDFSYFLWNPSCMSDGILGGLIAVGLVILDHFDIFWFGFSTFFV